MKFILRFVTLSCYFVPCIFFVQGCSGLFEVSQAFNQSDADKNRLTDSIGYVSTGEMPADSLHKEAIPFLPDSLHKVSSIPLDSVDKTDDLMDRILQKIIAPSANSLSAIGSLFFFKNTIGRIFIGVSLLISVVLLVFYRVLKGTKLQRFFLTMATIAVTAFIADALIVDVTLLWGAWTLLTMLILQLILEINTTTQ